MGFWDPAGFTADGSVENFKRRRQTELKHGRISMLATMGYITPETLVRLQQKTTVFFSDAKLPVLRVVKLHIVMTLANSMLCCDHTIT